MPALSRGLLLASFIAPLVVLYEICIHVVNAPSSWDEWDAWVPLILAMHNGTLTFGSLWALHNEHRMLVSNLIMLGLAKAGGWNMLRETLTSLTIVVLTQAMLLALLARAVSAKILGAAFLLATACLYNLMAYENWLTGFQTAWFLVDFAAMAVILLLWMWPRSRAAYSLAVLVAFAASFSMSSGLMTWLVGLFVLCLRLPRASRRALALWTVLGVAAFALYFYGYQTPPSHPSLLKELSDPVGLLVYLLGYFGAPFASWAPNPRVPLNASLGLVGLIIFAMQLLLYVRDKRGDVTLADRQTPFVALSVFSLLVGILTAIGRSGFGPEQALTSRYISNSSFLWIGIIGLAAIHLGELRSGRLRTGTWAFAAIVVLFFGLCYVEATRIALVYAMNGFTKVLLTGARALAHPESAAPADLQILYPSLERVRSDAAQLKALHEGPYYGD